MNDAEWLSRRSISDPRGQFGNDLFLGEHLAERVLDSLLKIASFRKRVIEERDAFVKLEVQLIRLPPDEVFEVDSDSLRRIDGLDFEDEGDGFGGAVEGDLKVAEGSGVGESLGGLLHDIRIHGVAGLQTGGGFKGGLGVTCRAVKDDLFKCVLRQGRRCKANDGAEDAKRSEWTHV